MAQGQHHHLAFIYRINYLLGHKQILALVFLLTATKPTEILTSIIQFPFCYYFSNLGQNTNKHEKNGTST